jgi:hypothetical protein
LVYGHEKTLAKTIFQARKATPLDKAEASRGGTLRNQTLRQKELRGKNDDISVAELKARRAFSSKQ